MISNVLCAMCVLQSGTALASRPATDCNGDEKARRRLDATVSPRTGFDRPDDTCSLEKLGASGNVSLRVWPIHRRPCRQRVAAPHAVAAATTSQLGTLGPDWIGHVEGAMPLSSARFWLLPDLCTVGRVGLENVQDVAARFQCHECHCQMRQAVFRSTTNYQ
jgi:hypothetical protein